MLRDRICKICYVTTHELKEGAAGKKKGFESSYNKKDSYEELRVKHYRDVMESWCTTLEQHVEEERTEESEKEARRKRE